MSFDFKCPHCNVVLSAEDGCENSQIICPECRNPVTIKKEAFPAPIPPEQKNHVTSISKVNDGSFYVDGDSETVWQFVLQAMSKCDINIRKQDFTLKNITGNRKYGDSTFGITVTANIRQQGTQINVIFNAAIQEGVDSLGVCRKLVLEVGDEFMQLCRSAANAAQPVPGVIPAAVPDNPPPVVVPDNPPPVAVPCNMNNNPPVAVPCSNMNNYFPDREIPWINPGIPAVLSMIIPGAGQVYNGQIAKGIIIQIVAAIIIWLVLAVYWPFAILLPLNILCIFDAYSIAASKNAGIEVGDFEWSLTRNRF